MKILKIVLWITAIGCLAAVPLIFVPWSVVAGIVSFFGVEPIPSAPFIIYFFRVACGVFGLVGVFYALLALNPLRYGAMLNLGAYGLILFGFVAIFAGILIGITPVVYLGDGLSGFVLGIVILVFAGKARHSEA